MSLFTFSDSEKGVASKHGWQPGIASSPSSTAQWRPSADARSFGFAFAFADFPFWTIDHCLASRNLLFCNPEGSRYVNIMKLGPKLNGKRFVWP